MHAIARSFEHAVRSARALDGEVVGECVDEQDDLARCLLRRRPPRGAAQVVALPAREAAPPDPGLSRERSASHP